MKGFPRVIGALDGTYIPCRTPAHKLPNTYINRKGGISMTLQGICDSNKLFLDVFVGMKWYKFSQFRLFMVLIVLLGFPSKTHDSRILSESFINEELPTICGVGDYHIIGDSAYPLQPFLLTPFRNPRQLTPPQRVYNARLCGTRVVIEQAFALLKQRFRQLLHQIDFHTVEKMCKFMISCCVLHNMCIAELDDQPFDDAPIPPEDEQESGPAVAPDAATRAQGKQKRDQIMMGFQWLVYSNGHDQTNKLKICVYNKQATAF